VFVSRSEFSILHFRNLQKQVSEQVTSVHISQTAVTHSGLAIGDNGLAKEIFHKFWAFQTRAGTLSLKAFEQNELQVSTLEQVSGTNGSGTWHDAIQIGDLQPTIAKKQCKH